MLQAFKDFIKDFKEPEKQAMTRALVQKISKAVQYLVDCRPQSTSMGNTIRWLKFKILHVKEDLSFKEAKQEILDLIDDYLNRRIFFADELIVKTTVEQVQDKDVILTFGRYDHSIFV